MCAAAVRELFARHEHGVGQQQLCSKTKEHEGAGKLCVGPRLSTASSLTAEAAEPLHSLMQGAHPLLGFLAVRYDHCPPVPLLLQLLLRST
eukprot:SAG31_NODE_148_length_22511_cov_20.369266_12_plen_91_part_00